MADICLMVIKYRLTETYGEWRDWWRTATWRDIDILSLLFVAWILFAGLSMAITLLIKSLALKIAGVKPDEEIQNVEADEAEEPLPEAPRVPPLPSPANHNHKNHDNPGHSLPPLKLPVKVPPQQTTIHEKPQLSKRICPQPPQPKVVPINRPSQPQQQQQRKSQASQESSTSHEWLNALVSWLSNLANDGATSDALPFKLSPGVNFSSASSNNDASCLSPLVSVWLLALNEALTTSSDASSASSSTSSSPPVLKVHAPPPNTKTNVPPAPLPNRSLMPVSIRFDGVLQESVPPSITSIRLISTSPKSLVRILYCFCWRTRLSAKSSYSFDFFILLLLLAEHLNLR